MLDHQHWLRCSQEGQRVLLAVRRAVGKIRCLVSCCLTADHLKWLTICPQNPSATTNIFLYYIYNFGTNCVLAKLGYKGLWNSVIFGAYWLKKGKGVSWAGHLRNSSGFKWNLHTHQSALWPLIFEVKIEKKKIHRTKLSAVSPTNIYTIIIDHII